MNASTRILAMLLAVLLWLPASALAQHIVIDPGHGGNDPGGTGTGMQEKEVVLDISLRFRDLLVSDTADSQGGGSWSVNMTRDTDVFIPLAARSDYANSIDADRFMSIHANAFSNPAANGTETFSYGATTISANLRNLVQEEMISAWGLTDRGNKTAGFSVLVNTAMPAELHELGFITNATDAAKLGSSSARQSAAVAHLRAIQRHYNINPYLPGTQSEPGRGSLLVVVHSKLGVAIPDAVVSIDGEVRGASNEEGELYLDELAAGEYLVSASAEGYRPIDAQVEIVADTLSDVLLVLPTPAEQGGDERGGGSGNCDSAQPECSPPGHSSDSLDGGCSGAGGKGGHTGGLSAALLLLVVLLRWGYRPLALLPVKRRRRD